MTLRSLKLSAYIYQFTFRVSAPLTIALLMGVPHNFNPTVASAVKLPDGNQYGFQYNSWGELARVSLPTGGAIEYDYGDGAGGLSNGYQTGVGGVMIYRRLQQRREYVNGGTGSVVEQPIKKAMRRSVPRRVV